MAGMYGCFKGRNSDGAAMASGPPDVMVSQDPAEVQEECSGKKKSKFQTFKKLFARKKRKEPAGADTGLKASQSSDDVSKASENNTLTRSEKEKGSGSKISLGSKALSHDSVFVSDSSEANEALGASQDSIHGKVKSLQLQLKQAIRLGSPPSLMCVKRADDAGTMSEDDGLPCSPPEYTSPHAATLSCGASSRAVSPLVVPGDFSQPASPFACLDNSAAKHKLGLRHKACNRRKPVSKLEVKMEGESAVDGGQLNSSITGSLEDQEQQKTEVLSPDKLKPEMRREEEEEKEEIEEEEKEQSEHSRNSLLGYSEEREEAEDSELEAEQDIPENLDTSAAPEQNLTEEEALDGQPLPSSESSSRTSSLDSPSATPEPPAGLKEYLLDPPGSSYGSEEKKFESELELRGEEDGDQENREEEESSFLQEVLSSLKTPLVSCSLSVETEGVTLKTEEETKGTEEEEVEKEDEEEEGGDVDEAESDQCVPSDSLLLDHTGEEEEEVSILSSQEEVVPSEETMNEEEEEGEEEEELVVERVVYDAQEEATEKEDAEEFEPEEECDPLISKCDIIVQDERGEEESETEEEVIEVEKEAELDEEEGKNREKDDEEEEEVEAEVMEVMEVSARLEEMEEVIEEVMTENICDRTEEEVEVAVSLQEADEDGDDCVVEDDTTCTTEHTSDDEIPTEPSLQQVPKVEEVQESAEMVEEVVESDKEKSDEEENVETNTPDMDETEHENLGMVSYEEQKQVEKDETEDMEQISVSARPSSLFLLETHCETPSQESEPVSPSKTSTIHINLVSPTSEKAAPFFQQSPTATNVEEPFTEPSSPAPAATEQQETPTDEDQAAAAVEEVVEEQGSALKDQDTHPTSVEETVKQAPTSPEQSKVRFNIAPAWQRSHSLTPPSSPPAATEPAGEAQKDTAAKAEPASPEVEVVLSPGKLKNVGSFTVKPQSNETPPPPSIKPQASAAANTEDAVVVEGNPFGVRLRKTSTLHLFSSEEANTESAVESPVQPTSCKAEPPQPLGVKPSINQAGSNKPALPKKPDVHGDSGVKSKCISDPAAAAAARGVSTGSDSPSWISMAKQKQKIYKESSMEEITVKKEERERKSSLPAASQEPSSKTSETSGNVSSQDLSKPPASVEKEARRSISPSTPVSPQTSKVHLLPCSVSPKPYVPPAAAKLSDQRSVPAPTPVPVTIKSPLCTSPLSLPKPASSPTKCPQPKSAVVTPVPFSSRTAAEKSGSRAAALPGQTPPSQRGLPPPASPQDEPPWMALAKKKAKAWSEMPQIVQ